MRLTTRSTGLNRARSRSGGRAVSRYGNSSIDLDLDPRDLALTQQDLAEMTGTTRYTISRMLSEWEQKGIVKTGRGRVLIKLPGTLLLIAEDLPAPTAPLS